MTVSSRADLSIADLHGCLSDPYMDSMRFLSEFASRYPSAVSFASGRPSEVPFDDDLLERYLHRFRKYLSETLGYDAAAIRRVLLQYGPTKGIINSLVAGNLLADEGIEARPESVVVTTGCQEAMFLTLRALCAGKRDAILAVIPTYVGITGAARLVDMPVLPVSSGSGAVDLPDLEAQIGRARQDGLRPRACYVIPDFANPSGMQMRLGERRRMLEIAAREDILVLEDNPYGLFHGGTRHMPTLKSLDESRRVVYLGSYAKTVTPGTRVGFVVADQTVVDPDGGGVTLLADQIAKIKSMVTVNTSSVDQAVIGGALLECDGNLSGLVAPQRAIYSENMKIVQRGLAARFRTGAGTPPGVSWNSPSGSFFTVVTVPFAADEEALAVSAAQFGVLWTPMRHFYTGQGGADQLRLSCSELSPEEIEDGLDRFAAFVRQYAGSPA
ncbi:MAG: PLP-dependent aminotransferase family protein [Trebonia sp.]